MKRTLFCMLMLPALLAAASAAPAATVHFSDYFFPVPLSRVCQYSYVTPVGYPGFAVTVTQLTSGPYAGHFRWGDYNIPAEEEAAWRIGDFDKTTYSQQYYLFYADSIIGDLPEPAKISATYTTDTLYPSPIPGSSGIYWYVRYYSSLVVRGKTYQDVMLWVVFDSKFPATGINAQLGLQGINMAVSTYTYYAKGIGELEHTSAASDGSVRYTYVLQSTGVSSKSPAAVSLLLD